MKNMKKSNNKRLFFDIETSYNIGSFWEAGYDKKVPYTNIIKERAIICICYKWEGDSKIYYLTWDKDQCDKKMLTDFMKVMNEADEIVGQNSDRFDIPWVRTRCLIHGISMFPTYATLDTLKIARSKFKFNSNTLDYMSKIMGFKGKLPTSYDLWDRIILNKEKKALDYMVKYCQADVKKLEQVFNKLKPYIVSKVHFGALKGEEKTSCPECSSNNTKISKTRISALGTKKIQMQCNDCGKYHTLSESIYNKII